MSYIMGRREYVLLHVILLPVVYIVHTSAKITAVTLPQSVCCFANFVYHKNKSY